MAGGSDATILYTVLISVWHVQTCNRKIFVDGYEENSPGNVNLIAFEDIWHKTLFKNNSILRRKQGVKKGNFLLKKRSLRQLHWGK